MNLIKQYQDMLENLKKYNILLASKSPRRRELLREIRVPFHTISIGKIAEDYPADMEAARVPEYLSQLKAEAYSSTIKDDEMIITADTVVILDGKIYGKPADSEEAVRMLRELSGKTHQVVTGVTVATRDKRVSFACSTDVEFAEIADEDIRYYVDNYRPLDKAGAYGIQEWIGCVAVRGIRGSFYNVMGLPIHRLYEVLRRF